MSSYCDFSKFKTIVRSKGGIWSSKHVIFSQMQAYYLAAYKPNYPDNSPHDQTLTLCHVSGMWRHDGADE